MLQPANFPMECWANAVFPTDPFEIEVADGVFEDLTGKVVTMQVRVRPGAAGDPLIDLTSADGSGDRTWYLQMSKTGSESLLNAGVTLYAQIQRNPLQ